MLAPVLNVFFAENGAMAVMLEQGKEQIAELIRHFRTNESTYAAYKEADARQSLIDPLFMALGWDVRNESRTAPQYREVILEESLEVEGHRRAPDYTFRVGQTPKFYAEAKRTGVNVKDDPAAAYQLRRYAWSAKLSFSILTSFAQLAVYDCRMRPAESDKAGKGRISFYTCEEYADRWRELWDVFSREAVWSGSFDQFIQSQRGKRGTEVDRELLKKIEGWRDLLARNIALRNLGISQRHLNVAVQRTIDRIVFLRICEDRGIEPYGTLQALGNSGAIYARLGELFHKADQRYNSGLFYFTAERDRGEPRDETTLALAIDDKPLKDILKSLYFPDLGANIKCGNSLIGPDFYNGRQLSLLDDEEQWRINAFDWKAEFPTVFKAGGFDAVIGNPPYLFITEVPEDMRWYYQQNYRGASYRFDLYGAFVEKAATSQLRPGGVFGFITPLHAAEQRFVSGFAIAAGCGDHDLPGSRFRAGRFPERQKRNDAPFFQELRPSASSMVEIVRTTPKLHPDCIERFVTPQKKWVTAQGDPWLVHTSDGAKLVGDRMKAATHSLAECCTANQGLRTGDNAKYLSKVCRGSKWKPAVGGKQISRYGRIPTGLYVLYEPKLLDAPRRLEIFTPPAKIAIQEIRNIRLPRRLVATLDTQQTFCLQSTNVINTRPGSSLDIRYILGLLNSAAVNFFFRCSFPGNNHIPSNQLLRIPIPVVADKTRHDRFVELVEGMLRLHEKSAAGGSAQQSLIQRQIQATDRQIDQLVYELYGLTDEEIAVVETASEAAIPRLEEETADE
jgi:hypothetical protein